MKTDSVKLGKKDEEEKEKRDSEDRVSRGGLMLPISGTERLRELQDATDPDCHSLTPDTPRTPFQVGEVVTLPRSSEVIFLSFLPFL